MTTIQSPGDLNDLNSEKRDITRPEDALLFTEWRQLLIEIILFIFCKVKLMVTRSLKVPLKYLHSVVCFKIYSGKFMSFRHLFGCGTEEYDVLLLPAINNTI